VNERAPLFARLTLASASLALLIAGPSARAQQDTATRAPGRSTVAWDATLPRGATREIDFTTSEGTWTAVDVAPDGRWVYFDLLGHIYRVSSSGGTAECLTQGSGVALNFQPRVSPDGRTIAFISDRTGQNNLWIMDADGGHPKAVFTDLNVRAVEPAWTPDGQFIVVRREAIPSSNRAQGAGGNGLWMYHRDGGEGQELVAATGRAGPAAPSVSGDGRFIYFHQSMSEVRDEEPLSGLQQLRRFEFKTGQVVDITAGEATGPASNRISSGGAIAPEVSPDGRWLTFAREIPDGTITFKGHKYGPRTALWLRDLHTGSERLLMDPIEPQNATGSEALGVLPRYKWAGDGRSVVIAQGGKIRRVDVASGAVTTIPYTARVHRTISEMAYHTFRIDDGPFGVKFMRWQSGTPDGQRIAFQAVGRIWVAAKGSPSKARRVTPASFGPLEYGPAWSPDGRWIAFTTWDDTGHGHLWKVSADGGAPQRLTRDAGEYIQPSWSPDGRSLVVVRGAGATGQGRTIMHDQSFDVVRVAAVPPASGDTGITVATIGRPTGATPTIEARRQLPRATFGPDGRIFYPEERMLKGTGGRDESVVQLMSVAPDGNDRRAHLTFSFADEIAPSPDGRWVAFQEGDNVYLTAMPYGGIGEDALRIDKRRGKFPVKQISREGGLFPHWRDANTLEYGSGTRYFTYRVDRNAGDTTTLALTVPRDVPTGTVALTNARIVTLDHRKVIEKGNIVVHGGRITCVGEGSQCSASGADRVIDVAGATIIPGFIDMHSHHYREHRGMRPRRDFESAIYLAYGVTTSMDVSMWSQNIFPTAEMIEAGEIIGPRTFSTGDPLYRGDAARNNDLSSPAVAKDNVVRLADWGATAMKQYMQPRRDQRQWVSEAARARGVNVTAEGGDLLYDVSMIMDGQTGWEHPIGVVPLYSDAAKFFGKAHATYSPTLVVAGPAAWNIEYWYQQSDVWKDPKQRAWFPWRMLIPHTRVRTLRPETDYSYPLIAQGMADVIAEGGYGSIGSHGEHHGLAAHWEVWMGASALGNMGALEVASLQGAHFLGADKDLGSLEVGKLADLMVLNSNPLDNIRNTTDMRYVMKGGRLYDAMTLDEVWPKAVPFGPHPWVNADALQVNDKATTVFDH
jgi:Tol biopolymer transport system component